MFERIARTYVKHLPWETFVSKSDNLEVRLVTLCVHKIALFAPRYMRMWEDVVRARCGNGQFPKPSLSLSTPKPSITIKELFTCYFQMVEKNIFPSLAT